MDTTPFRICPEGERPVKPRKVSSPEGLGDRMRTAAFAEKQAVAAFAWAVENLHDAPPALRADWQAQIPQEQEHYDLIVARMAALGLPLDDRPVSRGLWDRLSACTNARDFCLQIVAAEERGRQAGLKLAAYLKGRDPDTAAVFQRIAEDEVAHVALADTYFAWKPDQD